MVEFGTSSAFRGWVRVRVLGYGFGVRGRKAKSRDCAALASDLVRAVSRPFYVHKSSEYLSAAADGRCAFRISIRNSIGYNKSTTSRAHGPLRAQNFNALLIYLSSCLSTQRARLYSDQSPSRAPRAATRGALQPRAQRA